MKLQITIDDIRKRPGMYVGNVDVRGVYTLLFDFVKAIIDSSKNRNIFMEIYLDIYDTFYIKCDHLTGIKDFLEIKIIKALSCNYNFSEGKDSFDLVFKPDKKIFFFDTIEYYRLFGRLKELAQLNNNIKIFLSNDENKNIIHFQHGMKTMLMEGIYEFRLPNDRKPLDIQFENENIEVSVSMIYAYASDVALSYFNDDRTQDGGTHVQGLQDGIYDAFREYIQLANIDLEIVKDHPLFFIKEQLTGQEYVFNKKLEILLDDVLENLNFVIKVNWQKINQVNNIVFSGSTKRKLVSEKVYTIVKNGVFESLKAILDLDPSFFYSSRVILKAEVRKILSEK